MNTLKLKTTSGKTAEVDRDTLVAAAVDLLSSTFAESHSVIIWGGATTGRFAIVPYNSKLHGDEN